MYRGIEEKNKGKRFGSLVSIRFLSAVNGHPSRWLFKCDCGNFLTERYNTVNRGMRTDCGCINPFRYYGPRGESILSLPEYRIWQSIRNKTLSPKNSQYHLFSKMECPIDPRWEFSLNNFLFDLGRKPYPGACLLRHDKKKGYYKDNCYWGRLTKENGRLRENINLLDGEIVTFKEAAEVIGISLVTLNRYRGLGHSLDEIKTIFKGKCEDINEVDNVRYLFLTGKINSLKHAS